MDKVKARGRKFWDEWVRPLLIVALVLGSFRSAFADWNDVPTGSMKPTILEGDRVFVNKLAYDLKVPFTLWRLARWADPERGDIVVLFSPHDGKRLVKRIVGIPGDRLEMKDRRLHVNGRPAEYQPADGAATPIEGAEFLRETVNGRTHLIMLTPGRPNFDSFEPVDIPAGKYFLVGDNRDNSFDSRFWGFADRESIVGEATAVALSVDLDNYWLPRWSRFFSRLE
ncbi:MAG: signal peptidase I [Vicinamibacteria bacterium]|nr:signal peptidase I [Vicinamibacteria bacterium]